MIVLKQTNKDLFSEQPAPTGIYQPIEIQGNLWVLPDEAEQIVIDLRLSYTKRAINDDEWIISNPT